MTKKEIINKLISKENFKLAVEICISEKIEMNIPIDFFPDIVIYDDDESDYIYNIDLNNENLKFKVNNKFLSGAYNFFKYYDKITEFDYMGVIYRVIPCLIKNIHWVSNEDFQEIGYDLHSLSGPSIETGNNKRYYINGQKKTYKDWNMARRKYKLERILKK